MTIAELKQALSYYDDNLLVKVGVGNFISPLVTVTCGTDIDSNQSSVWLCAYRGEWQ